MSYLLDTHGFLWAVLGDPRLSQSAADLIDDPGIQVYVSLVSLWEIAIKSSIGKLTFTLPVDTFLRLHLSGSGIDVLHPTLDDVLHVASLPLHHRDPFDRLLVAQSLTQNMPLISADAQLDAYGIQRVWEP